MQIGSVLGAVLTIYVAYAIQYNACDEGPSFACDRENIADGQLVLASIGILPSTLIVVDTHRRRRRSLVWLAFTIVLYGTWVVLADIAVHGEQGWFGFFYG
jgi:cell division protein FtsW (lipid II flippase)